MKNVIPAVIIAAVMATHAMANPAVDSWPWEDTIIHEPNYAEHGLGRSCVNMTYKGFLVKPRESYVQFQCGMYDDYTTNPTLPAPGCASSYSTYFCSMQDCRDYMASPQMARGRAEQHKNAEVPHGKGVFHWFLACAVQHEPGGKWEFDDSPGD